MRRTFAFIHKEFRHILRDKRTLLIVFAMPIVLVLLFGFVISTEVKNAKVAILDHSKDELSTALVNRIAASKSFDLETILFSNRELEEIYKDGSIKFTIVIPANFSKEYYKEGVATVQFIADASDLNTATMLINYANAIIQDFQADISAENRHERLFETTVNMRYNPELKSVHMFVPGVLALVLSIIAAMMTAISLTKEKELGTFRVLTISPLKASTIVIGKVIPYLVISVMDTIIILGLSVWILGMPIHGDLFALFVVCLMFLLTAMSLGILISSFTSSQQVAALISIVGLYLPTVLLSGFIYPIENMPLILQGLCQIFPAKWFIVAIKDVMIKGVGFSYYWFELLVLLFMIIIFLTISIKRYTKRIA